MSKIGIAVAKIYAFAAATSFFALVAYHWWRNDTFVIWEPNPLIHSIELIMMIASIPGLALIAWRIAE